MFNRVKARQASMSIEISLTVLLSAAVLTLALGLFSENLKVMAKNSHMADFFKINNSKSKTLYKLNSNTPTDTKVSIAQIPQGQNVQIVADQGQQIKAIHDAAAAAIAELAAKPQPLSSADMMSLAEQLTTVAMSASQDPQSELDNYADIMDANNIVIQTDNNNNSQNQTSISDIGKSVFWGNKMPNKEINYLATGDDVNLRLANIESLKSSFN